MVQVSLTHRSRSPSMGHVSLNLGKDGQPWHGTETARCGRALLSCVWGADGAFEFLCLPQARPTGHLRCPGKRPQHRAASLRHRPQIPCRAERGARWPGVSVPQSRREPTAHRLSQRDRGHWRRRSPARTLKPALRQSRALALRKTPTPGPGAERSLAPPASLLENPHEHNALRASHNAVASLTGAGEDCGYVHVMCLVPSAIAFRARDLVPLRPGHSLAETVQYARPTGPRPPNVQIRP